MIIISKSDKRPKEANLISNVWLSRYETLTLFSGSRLCITSIETRNTDTLQWVTSLYYLNRDTKHWHSSVGDFFVLRQSRHETLTLFSGSRLYVTSIEIRNTDTLQWVTSLYYVKTNGRVELKRKWRITIKRYNRFEPIIAGNITEGESVHFVRFNSSSKIL